MPQNIPRDCGELEEMLKSVEELKLTGITHNKKLDRHCSSSSGCSSENSLYLLSSSEDMNNVDLGEETASDSSDSNAQNTRNRFKKGESNLQYSETDDSKSDDEDVQVSTQNVKLTNDSQVPEETSPTLLSTPESRQFTLNTPPNINNGIGLETEQNMRVLCQIPSEYPTPVNKVINTPKTQMSPIRSDEYRALRQGDEAEGAWGPIPQDEVTCVIENGITGGADFMNLRGQYDKEDGRNEVAGHIPQDSPLVPSNPDYNNVDSLLVYGQDSGERRIMHGNRNILDLEANLRLWTCIEAPALSMNNLKSFMEARSQYHRLSVFAEQDDPIMHVICAKCSFLKPIYFKEELNQFYCYE